MKRLIIPLLLLSLLTGACTSSKHLAYLENLGEAGQTGYFPMTIPDYKIQIRDILYITVKAMTTDGMITDYLSTARGGVGVSFLQSESGQYMYGFDVNKDGDVLIPILGRLRVEGLTLGEVRDLVQVKADEVFVNAMAECKLLSFKFTVIGEVKAPGAYINYNNYLTVLEAIGRAGGIGDFGRRDRVVVVRPEERGTQTFILNLQDKSILSSEGYFLMPNDVVIVEPRSNKVFNMNLPVISFIITTLTSTVTMLVLILNYTGGN